MVISSHMHCVFVFFSPSCKLAKIPTDHFTPQPSWKKQQPRIETFHYHRGYPRKNNSSCSLGIKHGHALKVIYY
jgi:hypothetical protein